MADLTEIQSSQAVKIAGANGSGVETHWADVTHDGFIKASVGSRGQLDAFNRLRVSGNVVVFTNTFTYDLQPNYWDSAVTGTGAITSVPLESSASLSVTGAGAGTVQFQTKRNFPYTPGTSRLVLFTGIFGAGAANVIKRYGIFDTADGLFFQLSGTTFSAVIRSSTSGSPVDTVINQSSWNVDPLDGTGPSGATLDLTKGQVMFIDYAWLGYKGVRFGFVIGSDHVIVHEQMIANTATVPYMSTGNLPVKAEIRSTSAVESSLKITCIGIYDESFDGKRVVVPRSQTVSTKNAPNGNTVPVMAIRVNPTKPKSILKITYFAVYHSGNAGPVRVSIVLNPTLTGGTFTDVPNSSAQVNTATTASTGGIEIFGSLLRFQDVLEFDMTKYLETFYIGYSDVAASSDVLALVVVPAANGNVTGSLQWEEEP